MTLNAPSRPPPLSWDTTKGSSISVNGAEINLGASPEPTYVTNTIAKQQTISDATLTHNGGYTHRAGREALHQAEALLRCDG